jgi:glycosyltransferase involved in cell wall biosynthesis
MNGTVVSDFVEENRCGWSVAPDPVDLAGLLQRLANGSEEVEAVTRISRRIRLEHTWAKRAERVASLLIEASEANH